MNREAHLIELLLLGAIALLVWDILRESAKGRE